MPWRRQPYLRGNWRSTQNSAACSPQQGGRAVRQHTDAPCSYASARSPDDPYNARCVRAAELTRVRLCLPGLDGTAVLTGPTVAQDGGEDARKTLRKLQKAARYAGGSPASGAIKAGGAPPVGWVQEISVSSDDDDSANEVETGEEDGPNRSKNQPADDKGRRFIHPPKGSDTLRTQSPLRRRGGSEGEVPRVPIWERRAHLTPPDGVSARDKRDAAAVPRILRVVVAKTFSLAMDACAPTSQEDGRTGRTQSSEQGGPLSPVAVLQQLAGRRPNEAADTGAPRSGPGKNPTNSNPPSPTAATRPQLRAGSNSPLLPTPLAKHSVVGRARSLRNLADDNALSDVSLATRGQSFNAGVNPVPRSRG